MAVTKRADARRNHARILEVAEAEVAEHGANASLEQIARVAGVGSATVRRHFPGRRELLQAVFARRIEALAALAAELADTADARAALTRWLEAFTDYASSARGMAEALVAEGLVDTDDTEACSARLTAAVAPLLHRAARDGAAAPEATPADLVTLVTGIALATEGRADAAGEARRLLRLTLAGIQTPA
ncbi:TetR/AcrR family transcriptional regulator [Marinactinospora thermotolerans]|uniref:Transcriptional regulator, TetR family n=1 Tax=Marinactinospora thermotolerans DSM 45154 TaxID=1122192 RepID=A0A1T4P9T6_9ACTN|nr:TetR/AcrR family transcriptional regulator [Marinactinospora thermotolerans]SJZ88335.1 transcriptional regulator, TetR family [Marinactinospora thermotolerans DSM 45154]